MVLPLNLDRSSVLDGLLTNVNAQRQAVGFNIAFNNLQNTVIDRMNKEIAKISNVEGNQRELDALGAAYDDLVARRATIVNFASRNEANKERFSSISNLALEASFKFSVGDANVGNISASEISSLEESKDAIKALSNQLVELSHPEFIDGNGATKVRSLVGRLLELTATEGVLDNEDSASSSNDNRAIIDVLEDIALTAGAAADTSLTLRGSSTLIVNQIDSKLNQIDAEIKTVNAGRAAEIEFEIQMLRIKNATFLRSIEVAFDTNIHGVQGLSAALAAPSEDPPLGSILSILT